MKTLTISEVENGWVAQISGPAAVQKTFVYNRALALESDLQNLLKEIQPESQEVPEPLGFQTA
jgi:hypothetical protein